MSITTDYYFHSPKSFAELTIDINAWLGCNLPPYKGNANEMFARLLAMEFSFEPTNSLYACVDDKDLESFPYTLSFWTSASEPEIRPIQLPTMLGVIFALHQRLGITGMLVFDGQILLARYEERVDPDVGKYLCDTVSGTSFIDIVEHLPGLRKRAGYIW